MNLRNALRYIYIYILTSKAGLEYDLQSREVWRGKREATRSYGRKHLFYKLYRVVCKKWGVCIRKCLHQRGNNADRRQREPFLGVSKREEPVIPQLSNSLYESDGLYAIYFVQDGGIPSGRWHCGRDVYGKWHAGNSRDVLSTHRSRISNLRFDSYSGYNEGHAVWRQRLCIPCTHNHRYGDRLSRSGRHGLYHQVPVHVFQ